MRKALMILVGRRNLTDTALFRGMLIAAISPAAVLIIEIIFFADTAELQEITKVILGVSVFLILFTILALCLLWLPWITLLRKFDAISWLNICIGAIIVNFIFTLSLQYPFSLSEIVHDFWTHLILARYSIASGVGFCIGAQFYSHSTLSSTEVRAAQASVAGEKDA